MARVKVRLKFFTEGDYELQLNEALRFFLLLKNTVIPPLTLKRLL